MAARTLDQIITSLNSTYDPQIKSLKERASLIPQQIAEEEKGLQAKQTQAFGDILGGARRRGLGFSGIPLGEQAQYTATEYLPALARLRQTGHEQALSLEDAILGVNERRNSLAQQLYQQEQDREFQRQQAEANRRAQLAAAASPTFDLNDLFGGSDNSGGIQATRSQRADKGFNFTIGGKPVSAATYAKATGTPFRSLLQEMANAGDTGARAALGFVGNDFGYDPRKIASQNLANLYNALVWGSGRSATYRAPSKPTPYNPNSGYRGNAMPRMF